MNEFLPEKENEIVKMMGALVCVQFLEESEYREFVKKNIQEDLKHAFSQIYCKETQTNIDCGLYELIKVGTINVQNFVKLYSLI